MSSRGLGVFKLFHQRNVTQEITVGRRESIQQVVLQPLELNLEMVLLYGQLHLRKCKQDNSVFLHQYFILWTNIYKVTNEMLYCRLNNLSLKEKGFTFWASRSGLSQDTTCPSNCSSRPTGVTVKLMRVVWAWSSGGKWGLANLVWIMS